jgi:hypothetical protein
MDGNVPSTWYIVLLMLLDSFVFVNSKVVLSGCNNDYVINCRLI